MAHAGVTPAHLHAIVSALAAPAATAAGRPGGRGGRVRWGGQQFSDPADLVAWINARRHGGPVGVQDFLTRHPGAAAIFAGGGTNAPDAAPGPGLPGLPPRRPPFPLLSRTPNRARRRPSPLLQLLGGG